MWNFGHGGASYRMWTVALITQLLQESWDGGVVILKAELQQQDGKHSLSLEATHDKVGEGRKLCHQYSVGICFCGILWTLDYFGFVGWLDTVLLWDMNSGPDYYQWPTTIWENIMNLDSGFGIHSKENTVIGKSMGATRQRGSPMQMLSVMCHPHTTHRHLTCSLPLCTAVRLFPLRRQSQCFCASPGQLQWLLLHFFLYNCCCCG